jgi:uncharacterized protein
MTEKAGRNDPCPCGSGKKYKQCCLKNERPRGSAPRKFKATVIEGGGIFKKPPDLMQRTFGKAIEAAQQDEKPPLPPQ